MNKNNNCRVFVASTWEDLKNERKDVLESLQQFNFQHVNMEYFGADPRKPIEKCLEEVKTAHVFVGIIGHRYGTILNTTGKSYTQMEYEEARKSDIPCLIYIRNDEIPIPPKYFEKNPNSIKKLDNFKSLLQKSHTPAFFKNSNDLAIQVNADLTALMQKMEIKKNSEPFPIESVHSKRIAVINSYIGKVKNQDELLTFISKNTEDTITLFDLNLNPIYNSPSILKLRGYTVEEAMTQTLDQTLTPWSLKMAHMIIAEQTSLESSGTADPARTVLIELEEYCKDGSTIWVEHTASFLRDDNLKPTGILAVTRNITERKDAEGKFRLTFENLRKAFGATIQVMVSAVAMKDPYTSGHQLRSADLAQAIATEMGLAQEKIDGIRMAGSIHDIGKLSIPAEILSKPTKLTKTEFSLIKEHARSGYEMLKDVESPWPLAEIIYQHHERLNGTGYPRNLKGDEILIESQILSVADVVEAMASHRPYRASLGIEAALEEIEKNKGILYDNTVVDACLKLFLGKNYQLP